MATTLTGISKNERANTQELFVLFALVSFRDTMQSSPRDLAITSMKLYDRTPAQSTVPAKRQYHLSKVDSTHYSSAKEQRAHIDLRKEKKKSMAVDPFHISHPGDLKGRHRFEDNGSLNGTREDWYDTAFICYESLYNQSSISDLGSLSMSTLAWGSQLDISTFQLHYGKTKQNKRTASVF